MRAAVGAGTVAAATGTAAAQDGNTTTVDMNDQLKFDPETVTVAPGTTVVWDNVGQIEHSVTAYQDKIPDGADYFDSGGFDTEDAARSGYPQGAIGGGETYEHTFDVEGTYDYFCIPHESVGMLGTVQVQQGGAQAGGSGEAGVPGSVTNFTILALSAMLFVFAFGFFFMKYGGDYGGGQLE